MLFSRYASNLLKMCRFVNLDLRLSTDVRRMIYRKDSSVLDLFNICGFNNSSTDVRQMLNGVFCGQQQIVRKTRRESDLFSVFCEFRSLFLYQIKHLDGIFGFGTAKEIDGNGYHG